MRLVLIFLFCSNVMAANFFPTEAELLNPRAHLIQFSGNYFKSSGNYDTEGVLSSLPAGYAYSIMNSDFKLRYGWTKRIEAAVSARLRSVSSTDDVNTINKTGAESAAVFLKYSFPEVNNLKSALGVRYRQTLYTNTKYDPPQNAPTAEVVLGDDGSEYAVELFTTYTSSKLQFIGNFSYQKPVNHLSTEILYKLESQYKFTDITLLGGLEGNFSLKDDTYTENPSQKPTVSKGSTNLVNSINREYMAPFIGMNYSFSKWAIGGLIQKVISGKSTDAGTLLAFNISTGTEGVTPEAIKIDTFKEYSIESSVLKVSARGNFLRIDQGLSSDIEKGMRFDIYQTDYFGGNVLVATGIAVEVGADWSVVKLTKKYKEIEIKPGFAARGY